MSLDKQIVGFIGWLGGSLAAGGIGAVASTRAPEFYGQLARPEWAPPSWLFGPVWTALYVMIAIAAWLVWRARGFSGARAALWLFIVQLGANAFWTWLFFGWRQGALAFGEILVLWVLIAATMACFWRIHRLAGALLIPYLCWVSFASALTYTVWQLNPGLL